MKIRGKVGPMIKKKTIKKGLEITQHLDFIDRNFNMSIINMWKHTQENCVFDSAKENISEIENSSEEISPQRERIVGKVCQLPMR